MRARIGLVGAGWRAQYYLRAAAAVPEKFEIAEVLVSSDASAERAAARWGVRTTTSLYDFLSDDYDFVVNAASAEPAPELTLSAARAGHAVLAETPPAPTRERLLHFYAQFEGRRVQIAEQYHLQAHHAARLAIATSGRLGRISWTRVSAAHGYHAVSLIRAFLGVGFGPVVVTGWSMADPSVASRGRDGWNEELVERVSHRTFARLDFGQQTGLYEFDFEQYVSPIRPRFVEIYGNRGQLKDDAVAYVLGMRHVTTGLLRRSATGIDGDLDGWSVDSIAWGEDVVWSNPYRGARLNDDEVAVADLMGRMAEYAAGGSEVYPLADGCHDQLLSLALDEAVETARPVRVDGVPWADRLSILQRRDG